MGPSAATHSQQLRSCSFCRKYIRFGSSTYTKVVFVVANRVLVDTTATHLSTMEHAPVVRSQKEKGTSTVRRHHHRILLGMKEVKSAPAPAAVWPPRRAIMTQAPEAIQCNPGTGRYVPSCLKNILMVSSLRVPLAGKNRNMAKLAFWGSS